MANVISRIRRINYACALLIFAVRDVWGLLMFGETYAQFSVSIFRLFSFLEVVWLEFFRPKISQNLRCSQGFVIGTACVIIVIKDSAARFLSPFPISRTGCSRMAIVERTLSEGGKRAFPCSWFAYELPCLFGVGTLIGVPLILRVYVVFFKCVILYCWAYLQI